MDIRHWPTNRFMLFLLAFLVVGKGWGTFVPIARVNALGLKVVRLSLEGQDAQNRGWLTEPTCPELLVYKQRCSYLAGLYYWRYSLQNDERAIALWDGNDLATERLVTLAGNELLSSNYSELDRFLRALSKLRLAPYYAGTVEYYQAQSYCASGESAEALFHYDKALQIAGSNRIFSTSLAQVHLDMGLCLMKVKNWDGALSHLYNATQDRELANKAFRAIAQIQFEQLGDREGALQILERLNQAYPSDRDTAVLLANYLSQTGQFERAISLLEPMILEDPEYIQAYFYLYYTYRDMGAKTEALDIALACIQSYPEVAHCWVLAGDAHMGLSEPGTAVMYFQKAIDLEPTRNRWFYLAKAYQALGDTENAAKASHMADLLQP